ncbi:hypothetical protein L1F30_16510 [Simiduia sp. 21SJ11W-1]|uniref:DnaT-like ssDNA-binding domain-containing protein n=1 Tax=Simiduia sp. 21SJ11W-1 TaxID=2909669 RepID=UPI0020A1EB90|nr:DnaT-like ssDNA-binding domain-containing protein [Simiduia sp. 21SJ11W-1]UTA47744.1 hypothetical protein L1F30_16510 [Simiduia sp. 21SJ11W-1]
MTHSLIPERPICISPSLAATLGLEEATLLSLLNDALNFYPTQASNGYQWCHLDGDQVRKLMPFWRDHDIARIAKSLRDKGVLLMSTAPFHESQSLRFAINERSQPTERSQAVPYQSQSPLMRNSAPTPGAHPMAPNWQPGEEVYVQLAQHNIPQQFARAQIPEFVTYWRDQGQAAHSWNAKFIQQVLRKWREQETEFSRREQEIPMTGGWRPSSDAMDVLVRHAGINQCFVEDAIAEFVLYWRERGESSRTWNSKFIQHVRRQWARYQTTLQYDTEPRPMAANWTPSTDVYEVLALANIDLHFAKQQLKEFVIYWRDTHQLHSSWNTKFLQHVKYQWAKRLNGSRPAQGNAHARQQNTAQSGRTRDRSVSEQLTDRSWAL